MQITFIRIIVWLIVGALAGSLVGSVVKRSREGFGWWTNLGVGLIGAAVGGFFFNLFGIDLGLGELAISFQDLVAAFMGSLIFLAAVLIVRKQMAKKRGLLQSFRDRFRAWESWPSASRIWWRPLWVP